MIRILITGSREWDDVDLIHRVLEEYVGSCDVTLVSGHCPSGADVICENFAYNVGWDVELYPAEWDKYSRAAGPLRNYEMVMNGADVCLAFIRNRSKGATMTAKLAQDTHIETRIFHYLDFRRAVVNAEMELINRRRRQIHVHSALYYHLGETLVDDTTFDKWSNELVRLQSDFPESTDLGYMPEVFADWTGDTGMHLPHDERVLSLGKKLLAYETKAQMTP